MDALKDESLTLSQINALRKLNGISRKAKQLLKPYQLFLKKSRFHFVNSKAQNQAIFH